jgi:hypothetical protein
MQKVNSQEVREWAQIRNVKPKDVRDNWGKKRLYNLDANRITGFCTSGLSLLLKNINIGTRKS